MRKVMAFVCVAMAWLATTCLAADYTLMADFKMQNPQQFPNGYVTGTLYYHLDEDSPGGSRVRFETNYINKDGDVASASVLYHYENNAVYSFCDACDAERLDSIPDAWFIQDGDICRDIQEGGSPYFGFKRCTRVRDSPTAYNLVEFIVENNAKPNDDSYQLKYLKFNDGREYYLGTVNTINNASYSDKFQVPDGAGCPQPTCRSYADIVFVIDASKSVVVPRDWDPQVSFLQDAISQFTISEDEAHVGIIQFASPWETCCKPSDKQCINYRDKHGVSNNIGGWMQIVCEGLMDYAGNVDSTNKDCMFDERCLIDKDMTSVVSLNLTGDKTVIENVLDGIEKEYGHTCQRYGLMKAYEMLFEKNDRCPPGSDRSAGSSCPIPIVIVVTDGSDQCRYGTKLWAEKIQSEDRRGMFIEVGVGKEIKEKDKAFLRSISSRLADGSPAYFDVTGGYSEMKSILDELMMGACRVNYLNGTTSCGSTCRGFCACSDCFCPLQCNDDAPNCFDYKCTPVNPEGGCKLDEQICNSGTVVDFNCYNEYCKPDSTAEDKCVIERRNCTAEYTARPLKPCEYVPCSNGCQDPKPNDTFCGDVLNLLDSNCTIFKCDPLSNEADEYGCTQKPRTCNEEDFPDCMETECEESLGGCHGVSCEGDCYDRNGRPKCTNEECIDVHCDVTATSDENRCVKEPHVCEPINNKCQKNICVFKDGVNTCELVDDDTALNCTGRNKKDGCRVWKCDPTANDGQGGCVIVKNHTHAFDICVDYICGEDDMWHPERKCTTERKCKMPRCSDDGSCIEVNVDCRGKVRLPNKCFEAACKEPDGCYKKQRRGAYFDVCGRCISSIADDSTISYSENEETEDCVLTSDEDLPTEGLAAAAIALIVIGAIIIGAAIALSSVVGTKALIDRARGASDQAVVSNPLFEDSQTEMTNPAFMGDA